MLWDYPTKRYYLLWRSYEAVLELRPQGGGRFQTWQFTGDATELIREVLWRNCPVGILLDRLTEYPEECDAPPEVVAEAVAQLRERNLNGNETNW